MHLFQGLAGCHIGTFIEPDAAFDGKVFCKPCIAQIKVPAGDLKVDAIGKG